MSKPLTWEHFKHVKITKKSIILKIVKHVEHESEHKRAPEMGLLAILMALNIHIKQSMPDWPKSQTELINTVIDFNRDLLEKLIMVFN
jgi:hypothetical protein